MISDSSRLRYRRRVWSAILLSSMMGFLFTGCLQLFSEPPT